MTGYFLLTKGEASLALRGWFANTLARGQLRLIRGFLVKDTSKLLPRITYRPGLLRKRLLSGFCINMRAVHGGKTEKGGDFRLARMIKTNDGRLNELLPPHRIRGDNPKEGEQLLTGCCFATSLLQAIEGAIVEGGFSISARGNVAAALC